MFLTYDELQMFEEEFFWQGVDAKDPKVQEKAAIAVEVIQGLLDYMEDRYAAENETKCKECDQFHSDLDEGSKDHLN